MDEGFPGGSENKEYACNSGDPGSIPGSERSFVEGNGYTFQYSCLEMSMDSGAWWATVHRLKVQTLSYKINTRDVVYNMKKDN